MVAGYFVFDIHIPNENGYAQNPNAVRERVIPHIQQLESYAELEHSSPVSEWVLTTPCLTAKIVVYVLATHYGFEAKQRDGFITK